MSIDLSALSLTEMIRLREEIAEEITRKFERRMAVAFSDVVGSTNYFARFGDNAGRALQQRHLDVLTECLTGSGGRIVDTAGDGAFLCFPSVENAVESLGKVHAKLGAVNQTRQPEHHVVVRVGVHFGPVLTDGTIATGESVNLCSRITATAEASTIRLTKAAFMELPSARRLRCKPLAPVTLKGLAGSIDVIEYGWRAPVQFPTTVLVEETGERHKLPVKDVITFGRLAAHEGMDGNDIVLSLPDEATVSFISRWHIELRRTADGFVLRRLSEQTTEVDGVPVERNGQVSITAGSRVRLGGVATLVFILEQAPTNLVATTVR